MARERRRKPRGWLRRVADALYGVLRFIAGHARGFYGAVITYLSFSFFIALIAVWVFTVVAQQVLAGSTQSFDEAVLTWVEGHRTALFDRIALEVTALGNFATLGVLVLGVSVFLWLTRHKLSVGLLLVALLGANILNSVLKDVFDRPRPDVVDWQTEVVSESFPSGHAMTAFVTYASVAYLVGRLEPTPAMRWTTWFLAALLILGIGASRVYVGVHYPSDVVGGFVAGLAWLGFVISGITAIRYFSRQTAEPVEEEQDLFAEEERERGLRR